MPEHLWPHGLCLKAAHAKRRKLNLAEAQEWASQVRVLLEEVILTGPPDQAQSQDAAALKVEMHVEEDGPNCKIVVPTPLPVDYDLGPYDDDLATTLTTTEQSTLVHACQLERITVVCHNKPTDLEENHCFVTTELSAHLM